jgi:hypothetical protein
MRAEPPSRLPNGCQAAFFSRKRDGVAHRDDGLSRVIRNLDVELSSNAMTSSTVSRLSAPSRR